MEEVEREDVEMARLPDETMHRHRQHRVITYNVHSFNDGRFQDGFPRLLHHLRRLRPDLLVLNEVLHPSHPPSADQATKEEKKKKKQESTLLDEAEGDDELKRELQKFLRSTGGAQLTSSASANPTEAALGSREDGNASSSSSSTEAELANPSQETTTTSSGRTDDNTYLAILSKVLELPYWTVALAGCSLNNVLLSRWPLKRAESVAMKISTYETRSLIVATTTLPPERAGEEGVDVDVLATHLEHTDERIRMQQLEKCLAYADPSRPLLLMGDLNAFTPDDYGYRHWLMIKSYFVRRYWTFPKPEVVAHLLQLGYIDCWRELHKEQDDSSLASSDTTDTRKQASEVQSSNTEQLERKTMLTEDERRMCTVWVGNPLLRIDYVFCTRAFLDRFDLVDCRSVHECDASDHFPVLLDFRSKAKPTNFCVSEIVL